jgi:hypothetical protein
VRVAYAKYECNHVYQTPSGAMASQGPAEFGNELSTAPWPDHLNAHARRHRSQP